MLPVAVVIVGIILLILIDVLYLSAVKDVIYRPLGAMMQNVEIVPGLISWSLIFFGCYYLGAKDSATMSEAAIRGALFGFFSYGIYNTTNMATISGLSPKVDGVIRMAVMDTLWGSLLCAGTSATIWYSRA